MGYSLRSALAITSRWKGFNLFIAKIIAEQTCVLSGEQNRARDTCRKMMNIRKNCYLINHNDVSPPSFGFFAAVQDAGSLYHTGVQAALPEKYGGRGPDLCRSLMNRVV